MIRVQGRYPYVVFGTTRMQICGLVVFEGSLRVGVTLYMDMIAARSAYEDGIDPLGDKGVRSPLFGRRRERRKVLSSLFQIGGGDAVIGHVNGPQFAEIFEFTG